MERRDKQRVEKKRRDKGSGYKVMRNRGIGDKENRDKGDRDEDRGLEERRCETGEQRLARRETRK
jgi:hypothetical protein